MEKVDNKVVTGSLVGLGIMALGGVALYKHFTKRQPQTQFIRPKANSQIIRVEEQFQPIITLIGDVGGTNIRYKLLQLTNAPFDQSRVIKQEKLKVAQDSDFSKTIDHFLQGVQQRPSICVIAIAGPVDNNTVLMSNVQRWGRIDGAKLGVQFKINRFVFINDFQANAYGIMTLKDNEIIKLNGLDPVDSQLKLIIGPGTGLGTALLIPVQSTTGRNQNFVLPGEGGHVGFAPSSELQQQYFTFLKRHIIKPVLVLQTCFCGPAIPYMFKFFAQKYPEMQGHNTSPSSEDIVRIALQKPDSLHRKAVQLFLQIYQNVVGDQLLQKLCYGGLYLMGSLTKAVLPLIQDPNLNWLSNYKQQRPYLKYIFQKVPIIVIKQTQLGKRGAFVYAKKLVH